MGRLIDKHTEIHPQAAATIYDWLDGKNVFLGQGNPLESSREEQANVLINWFREQVKKNGK